MIYTITNLTYSFYLCYTFSIDKSPAALSIAVAVRNDQGVAC